MLMMEVADIDEGASRCTRRSWQALMMELAAVDYGASRNT